jgi:hypothetical protein
MKKIFIITCFLSCFYELKAQPISDTGSYLKDSIIQKKSYYIGKPLIVLLKDLKVEIIGDKDVYSILGKTDTFFTKECTLWFFPLAELIDRVEEYKITPTIIVTFQDTLTIPRYYFRKGGILDYYEGWNRYKRNYWGQFIVADLRLTGVN